MREEAIAYGDGWRLVTLLTSFDGLCECLPYGGHIEGWIESIERRKSVLKEVD